jgi:hypothetical protein
MLKGLVNRSVPSSPLVLESPFIRRVALLAEAHDHLARLEASGGGLVMLSGPAGHGKTTLAREIRAQVERDSTGRGAVPMIMSTGQGREPALGIWARLAAVANSADLMAPEVLLGGAEQALTTAQRFGAVHELVKRIGIAGVPLVVIDDLHAADQASLIVFSQLVELLANTGVLILATTRGVGAMTDELSKAAHGVLEHHGAVVEVPAFTVHETRLRMELTGAPAFWCARRAPMVHEMSGGNPLIVDRVVSRILVDPGSETIELDSFVLDQISHSVVDIWVATLTELPPEERRVLRLVAALGELADKTSVMGATMATSSEAKEIIDHLVARGLIEQLPLSPCYRVAHPGITEALVAMTGDEAALSEHEHLRMARQLVQRRDPVDPRLVARHLQLAGSLVEPSELEEVARKGVAHAVQWGDRAAEAEAWTMVLDAHAAQQPDRQPSDSDLLAAAQAFRASGHDARSRQLAYEVAIRSEQADPLTFTTAALIAADGAEFHGDAPQMLAMLRRAHAAIENLPDQQLLRIDVLAALSQLEMTMPIEAERPPVDVDPEHAVLEPTARWNWVTQPEIAQPRTHEAEELAKKLGDPEVEARVGLVWRLAHLAPEFAAQRWERSERAHRILTSRSDRGQAVGAVLSDLWERGDRAGMDEAMVEMAGIVAETGDPRLRWRYLVARSGLERVSGDLTAAETSSVSAGIQGAVAGVHSAVLVRLEQRTLYEVDRLEGNDTVVGLTYAIATVQHPPLLAGVLSLAGDLVRAGVSDVEVSIPDLRALVERLSSPAAREQNWMMATAFAANAAAASQDQVAAAKLIALMSPYADRVARESWGAASEGSVARSLGALFGVVGDVSAAQEMFVIGDACNRAAGFQRAVLIGTIDRLECEVAAGLLDPAQAVVTAREVARDARSRGMLAIAARADRLGMST